MCVDMDECAMLVDVCKGGGVCVNTRGSFRCDCPSGTTLDSTGMRCVGQLTQCLFYIYEHSCIDVINILYLSLIHI